MCVLYLKNVGVFLEGRPCQNYKLSNLVLKCKIFCFANEIITKLFTFFVNAGKLGRSFSEEFSDGQLANVNKPLVSAFEFN